VNVVKRFHVGRVAVYVLLSLWAFTTIFPFVWVINNSFKDTALVINDSFAPAFQTVYQRDRDGGIVYEQPLLDEQGREMYDKFLFNEDGSPVLEKDQNETKLKDDSPFAGLLGNNLESSGTSDLQAYDTKNGKRLYDTASPAVKLTPTFENYVSAFTNNNVNILRGYKNSLVISGCVTLVVTILSTMLAFALTRYKFFGKSVVRTMVVAALMFPAFATIVPVYRMIASAGMFDTLQGVSLVLIAGNLAFATTVMMGFVAALPYELEEAAFMEGGGPFRIFFNIIFPMSRPAIATVAIFTFIWSYNDLFLQTVLLRSRRLLPVCAILREISSQYGTDFGLMAAAVTIVVMPVLLVYILMQKNIIKGLTAGAVKG
jgi:raffinose/stachyose/melibiose transport system permease protein